MPEFSTKTRRKDLSSKPAWATQDFVSEGKRGLEGSSVLATSQLPHGSSQWSVTPVPRYPTPSCRQSSNAH